VQNVGFVLFAAFEADILLTPITFFGMTLAEAPLAFGTLSERFM